MFGDDKVALGSLDETDSTDVDRRPWEFDLDSVRPGAASPSRSHDSGMGDDDEFSTIAPITEPTQVVSPVWPRTPRSSAPPGAGRRPSWPLARATPRRWSCAPSGPAAGAGAAGAWPEPDRPDRSRGCSGGHGTSGRCCPGDGGAADRRPVRAPTTLTARSCSNRAKPRPTGASPGRPGPPQRSAAGADAGQAPRRRRCGDRHPAGRRTAGGIGDRRSRGRSQAGRGGRTGRRRPERPAGRRSPGHRRRTIRLPTGARPVVRQRGHRRHRRGGRRSAPSPAEDGGPRRTAPTAVPVRVRWPPWAASRPVGDRHRPGGPGARRRIRRRTGDELVGPGQLDRPAGRHRHRRRRRRPAWPSRRAR